MYARIMLNPFRDHTVKSHTFESLLFYGFFPLNAAYLRTLVIAGSSLAFQL